MIDCRLPSIFQYQAQNYENMEQQKTWIFHPAEIVNYDCNMVLLQWKFNTKVAPFSTEPYAHIYREWIFKGSYQIKKLFDRFFPHTQQEVRSTSNRLIVPSNRAGSSGQNQGVKKGGPADWTTGFCDLTGDDDAIENLDFKYLPFPKSMVKPGKTGTSHNCSPECAGWVDLADPAEIIKAYPPLLRPMLFGFERFPRSGTNFKHAEFSHDLLNMYYKTACKKDIKDRAELDKYLMATSLTEFLEHDCFSFDNKVQINRRVDKSKLKGFICEDFSEGKENRPIPMYNQVDKDRPPSMIYSIRPILHESARINVERDFLINCQCTDGCRADCPCKRLTYEGAQKINALYKSYEYGRLVDILATGIFECNMNCGCNKCAQRPCQNSIVQRGVRQDLQLFKTFKKGWGVRTMSDIPFGAFICIYAGIVRSEDEAERHGRKLGDEYFANLDFIESGENTKKVMKDKNKDSGQESEAESEEEESNSMTEPDDKKEEAFVPRADELIGSAPSENGKLRRSSRKRKKKKSPKKAKGKPKKKVQKTEEENESDSGEFYKYFLLYVCKRYFFLDSFIKQQKTKNGVAHGSISKLKRS